MTEPDVTLTDYALVLECLAFVVLLLRDGSPANELRFWFVLYFASVSVASLIGGTVHGFFLDEQSLGEMILWPATLIAAGITALCAWAIGAKLQFSSRVARWVIAAASVQFMCYSAAIIFWSQEFRMAIFNSVPAMLFMFAAMAKAYRREGDSRMLLGAGAAAPTLIGGIGQQLRIGIHPVYFNHNALYHVLQAIALFLIFIAGHRLVRAERGGIRQKISDLDDPP